MKLVFFLRLSVICVSFMWRFTQIKYCLLACLRSNDERLQTKIEIELHMYTVLHKNKTTLPPAAGRCEYTPYRARLRNDPYCVEWDVKP